MEESKPLTSLQDLESFLHQNLGGRYSSLLFFVLCQTADFTKAVICKCPKKGEKENFSKETEKAVDLLMSFCEKFGFPLEISFKEDQESCTITARPKYVSIEAAIVVPEDNSGETTKYLTHSHWDEDEEIVVSKDLFYK
ncbi:MAG: hypothetical protein NTZ44_00125 [Candidatus Nomurabacteria bacterium]|nr:hypothetical protein [Candidatus Nomurabacteria bacterium]